MNEQEQIRRLERWKAEATQVIIEWEQVWEDAGRPTMLGRSKALALGNRLKEITGERNHFSAQIKKLADWIIENVPGEPSQSEGAVDTAIRLLAKPEPPPICLPGEHHLVCHCGDSYEGHSYSDHGPVALGCYVCHRTLDDLQLEEAIVALRALVDQTEKAPGHVTLGEWHRLGQRLLKGLEKADG